MTNLLDNELIRTYFRCEGHKVGDCMEIREDCKERTALRIIQSMQEPIKKDEKYLLIFADNSIEEKCGVFVEPNPYHPNQLRLPDRFQPKPAVKECPNLTVTCSCGMKISHPDVATRRHEGEPPAAPERECACGLGGPLHECKPPQPTERCCCGNKEPIHPKTLVCCNHASTDQAVESKIKEILNAEHDWLKDRLDYRLRELVLLARGGKG